MGPRAAARAIVLDAGALIAIEKGDRKVLALCKVATLERASVVVPAGVVAQVWRNAARQARLSRLVHATGTIVEPLDLDVAVLAGACCAHASTTDVVDATVVIAARQHGAKVLSSDADDLKRLDPNIDVIEC